MSDKKSSDEKEEKILIPSENWLVQKIHPLVSLWSSGAEFSLEEYKLLDYYLGGIDSHRPENRTVTFKKGELEALFGVTRIYPDVLDKHLSNLLKTLTINVSPNRLLKVNLFEYAAMEQDETTKQWRGTMKCSETAMELFFNIDNLGYFKYRLSEISKLKSRHAYLLYMYLLSRVSKIKSHPHKEPVEWDVELDELKSILGCSNVYPDFRDFNKWVLKPSCEELSANTTLKFAYSLIRKGRKVGSINFTVYDDKPESLYLTNEDNPAPKKKMTKKEEVSEFRSSEEYAAMPESAQVLFDMIDEACEKRWNVNQMKRLMNELGKKDYPPHRLDIGINRNFAKEDFVRTVYLRFSDELQKSKNGEREPIKAPFEYFLKMIKATNPLE